MLQNEISGSVLTYYNIISCTTDDTATLSICFRNGCKTAAVESYRSLFGYGPTITIFVFVTPVNSEVLTTYAATE